MSFGSNFNDDSNLSKIVQMIEQYFVKNSLVPSDIVYCKVFSVSNQQFKEVERKLNLIITKVKIFQIAQSSLQNDIAILIRIASKNFCINNKIHIYFSRFINSGLTIKSETKSNFNDLKEFLIEKKLTLLNNVIRSWIYVNDIDNMYQDVVEERKVFFNENDMGVDTRYLASTGIGSFINDQATSHIDFLSIDGIDATNIGIMKNNEIMPDTITYGVHFERGLVLFLKDRKHFYLSGTASIDTNGDILFMNDPVEQTKKALRNCAELLEQYNSSLEELNHMVVYLRNPNDFEAIFGVLKSNLPQLPMIFVHGPVCRPGWLVELEGMASH